MKRNQFTYSEREIVEIIQATKALIACLKLPGLENIAAMAPLAPPMPQDHAIIRRGYVVAGQKAPSLGTCPHCNEELVQGKWKPYCVPCWKAKNGIN